MSEAFIAEHVVGGLLVFALGVFVGMWAARPSLFRRYPSVPSGNGTVMYTLGSEWADESPAARAARFSRKDPA
jgi:hypothetical protein